MAKFIKQNIAWILLICLLLCGAAVGTTAAKYTNKIKAGTISLSVETKPKEYYLLPGYDINIELNKYLYNLKKVTFGRFSTVNNTLDNELDWHDGIPVSAKDQYSSEKDEAGGIRLFMVGDTCYILSKGTIVMNANTGPYANNMFQNLSYLEEINGFELIDTQYVTKFNALFYACSKLRSVNLSNINTSNATIFQMMFNACSSLTSLDLSNFNTKSATNMCGVFQNCSGLTELTFPETFKTDNVTNMQAMFSGCSSLTSLDLTGFNTKNLTQTDQMFRNCTSLQTVYVDAALWSTDNVTQSANMFHGCESLEGGAGTTWNAANPKDKTYAHIDGGDADPGYFTEKAYYLMPSGEINNQINNATTVTFGVFADYKEELGLTWDAGNIVSVTKYNSTTPKDGVRLFQKGTDYYILSEEKAPIYMNQDSEDLFNECKKLTQINGLDKINTKYATSFYRMFRYCESLISLDVSGFNTENVTNMASMFYKCGKLTTLDVSSFNTENVTDMNSMFQETSLTTLDVSNFDTEDVTDMKWMFGYTKVETLDLSSFDTKKVTNMNGMFGNCTNLTTIYVDETLWSTDAVTWGSNTFQNCSEKLVGGAGTVYSSSKIDKTYAHIDGGTANPGYLTEKAYTYYLLPGKTINSMLSKKKAITFGKFDDYKGALGKNWEDGTIVSATDYNSETSQDGVRLFNDGEGNDYILSQKNGIFVMNKDSSQMFQGFYPFTLSSFSGMDKLDASKVENASSMFQECNMVTLEGISGWKLSNVTDMSDMFSGCSSLISLNVAQWDTSSVQNMHSTFKSCMALVELDISGWDTAAVTEMSEMFYNAQELETIYVGDNWTVNPDTGSSNMFLDCSSLEGGNGTTYDSNNTDATYAHIDDRENGNPGYFTAKPASTALMMSRPPVQSETPAPTEPTYTTSSTDGNSITLYSWYDRDKIQGLMQDQVGMNSAFTGWLLTHEGTQQTVAAEDLEAVLTAIYAADMNSVVTLTPIYAVTTAN